MPFVNIDNIEEALLIEDRPMEQAANTLAAEHTFKVLLDTKNLISVEQQGFNTIKEYMALKFISSIASKTSKLYE